MLAHAVKESMHAGHGMQVMLCDVTSGGFTHTLSGHRAAVWAVHWSLQTEWQVMTGGSGGAGTRRWGLVSLEGSRKID